MQGPWVLVSVLVSVITTCIILILVVYCLYKAYMSPNVRDPKRFSRHYCHLLKRFASLATQMRSTLYTLVKQCILLGVCFVLVQFVHAWVSLLLVAHGEVENYQAHLEAFAVPSIGFMNFLIWFGFVKRGLAMVTGVKCCLTPHLCLLQHV
jgi:hypothetical protein